MSAIDFWLGRHRDTAAGLPGADLPWLVRHSRRVLGIIRQNLGLALGLKLIFLALALADRATLWMAIVADMGASLLVIANALRLLRAPGATRLAP